jgi:hypothetical protein
LDVGGHDGGRGVHAGAGVTDGGAAADRLAVGKARDAHDAASGLRDHVEALVLVVRPGEPEALDARHDDSRIHRAQPLVVEPELLHQPGREVLHDDVDTLDHPEEERPAVRMLEIERHAPLVGVEHEEEHRVESRHFGTVPARLLATGRLDLEDIGAQPAEKLRASGARLELREVEDPHPAERALGHGATSCRRRTARSARGPCRR